MRKYLGLAAAALALAVSVASATVASATTFVGSYSLSYQNSDPGLVLQYADLTPGAGKGFTFDLVNPNDTAQVNLFGLYTNEGSVNFDDLAQDPIAVEFSFTLPEVFGGGVDGTTGGIIVPTWRGFVQSGYVVWENNGNQTFNFGNGGQLLVHLDNAAFNTGRPSWLNSQLNPGVGGAATITADFKLVSAPTAAVPEPATWAMMLLGFFGLGSAVRSQRRRGFGLAAVSAA